MRKGMLPEQTVISVKGFTERPHTAGPRDAGAGGRGSPKLRVSKEKEAQAAVTGSSSVCPRLSPKPCLFGVPRHLLAEPFSCPRRPPLGPGLSPPATAPPAQRGGAYHPKMPTLFLGKLMAI